MNKQHPLGILLAAGNSSRFGSNKLLHPVTDNTPMLLVTAEKLAHALPGSIVVISEALVSYATQLENLDLRTVVNPHAEQGMGSSIARGIQASEQADDSATHWLIMLADMPYIQTETIERLADKLAQDNNQHASIIAPTYNQQRGHPVGFGRAYKHELLALKGDTGAREIIARHPLHLELLPVDDAGVIRDVDHPDDIP